MSFSSVQVSCCLLLALVLPGCARQEARFSIEPAVVTACSMPVSVTVAWDVSALGLQYAKLEVNNPGRPAKLWMQGGSKGEEVTGPWAHDGFTVTLRSLNGVELGRQTLTTTPCPGKPWL